VSPIFVKMSREGASSMATAIAILGLFVYFYFISKKERQQYYGKWLNIGNVPEDSLIEGIVIDVQEKKERFYQNYYIVNIDVILQTDRKKIVARRQIPANNYVHKPMFHPGQTIVCYGQWKSDVFLFQSFNVK